MTKVTLNNGTVVNAYLVTKIAIPAQIHIYPAELTIGEIYRLFDDPEATDVITVESEVIDRETGEKAAETKVFRGYTNLFSVQRSMYHPDQKEYMIWLQRPDVQDEE